LSERKIRELRVGDTVFISGTVITARDRAHERAIERSDQKRVLPFNFRGMVLYHCGPIVRRVGPSWAVVAAGPTTSHRMEETEAEFIKRFGVSMIVGKGGMGKKTSEALSRFGAVYCDYTGGAALLAAEAIERVEGVAWLDLGVPEAMWQLSVREFGPLLVTMDSVGNNYRDRLEDR